MGNLCRLICCVFVGLFRSQRRGAADCGEIAKLPELLRAWASHSSRRTALIFIGSPTPTTLRALLSPRGRDQTLRLGFAAAHPDYYEQWSQLTAAHHNSLITPEIQDALAAANLSLPSGNKLYVGDDKDPRKRAGRWEGYCIWSMGSKTNRS
jgi:hypothetical protein